MTRKQNLQILGLPANATNEQIKKRFRKLSKENHQDILNVLLETNKITKEEYDRRIEEYKNCSIAYHELTNNSKQTIDIDNFDDIFNSFGNIFKEQMIKEYLGEKLTTSNKFINILFEEAENKIKDIIEKQDYIYDFNSKEIKNILIFLVNETNNLLKTDIPYRKSIKEIKQDLYNYFLLTTNLNNLLINELFNHKNIIKNEIVMQEALNELDKFKKLIEEEKRYQQKLEYLNTYLRILHGFDTKAAWNEIENLFNETKKKQ